MIHDPLVCGIDLESSCPVCREAFDAELLARWPQLRQPGPEPHNQIGTLRQQLALARAGRQAEPLPDEEARRLAATIAKFPDLFAPVLMHTCGKDIIDIALEVMRQKGDAA